MIRKARLFSFRFLFCAWGMVLATGNWAFCPKMVLPNSPGLYSQVARCPMTTTRYARGVYLIRASEVSSSGLTGGSVLTGIGWNYNIGPGAPGLGSLVVYLQNTPDTANAKSTDWATAISGMTAVHNAPTTLPGGAGPFSIPFAGGSPFTYTGGGLYVAFDWQYGGTLAPLVKIPISSEQVGDMLQEQSDIAAPATLDTGGSDVRPETQLFVGPSGTDAGVAALYSLGSLPTEVAVGRTFQARITNNGNTTLTNLPVTLNITGADSFTDTQTVTLTSCASTTVSFAPFTPLVPGSCTVTASVPGGDADSTNNSMSHTLAITANICSTKYPGTPITMGIGSTGGHAEVLVKFSSDTATQVDVVIPEFAQPNLATYRVSVRGDNGSGAPGGQLYLDTSDRTITAAGAVTVRLPSPVAVGPGNFFVGVLQTNTTNMQLSIDNENPVRPGTFFLSRNGGPFSDFSTTLPYKPNIGAILGACLAPLSVDVTPDGTSSACPGNDIVFTATATGGTGTPTYQWTENGTDIIGADTASYTANKATNGTFTYNCRVSDIGGCIDIQDPAPSTGSWGPITVTNPAVATGYVSTFFSQTFTHIGGSSPVNFSTASALPAGFTLDSGGTLSGTAMTLGTYPIVVTATDTYGCTGTGATYTLVISCQTITVLPSSLSAGTAGVAYGPVTFSQSGGVGAITWVQTGALPAGMSFNTATAVLSGTPTQTGSFPILVMAIDANGCSGSQSLNVTINCPTITLAAIGNGTVGTAYSQNSTASPSGTAYGYAVSAGSLPLGLSLNTGTGAITGTPTTGGTYNFTITATGWGTCTGSQAYTITIACPTITLAPATLPGGTANAAYSQTVTASPSGTTYGYAVTAGSLPPGLSLNTGTGAITGTPSTGGTYNFTITATGWGTCTGSQTYTITIACPTITLAALANGTANTVFSSSAAASPGGTYTYAVTAGSLPPGLTLNTSTGAVTGTPTTSGTFNCTLTATAWGSCTGSQSYTVAIACPAVSLSPASVLPNATVGTAPYLETFSAAPPGTTYSYGLTAGSLPPGLVLDGATGTLTGTVTAAGNTSFTITATGWGVCSGSRAYSLTAVCPAITVSPLSLPGNLVGTGYSQTLTASGGTAPHTFAVTSGALPGGLSLSASGVLSGTLSVAGTFAFTVTATDFYGCAGSRQYTVAIAAFDLSFYDDSGRSKVCANSVTGDWKWTVLQGVGIGIYTGTAVVSRFNGTLAFTSPPASPYALSLKYLERYLKASGSFTHRAGRVSSTLLDSKTTNNPPGC
jgi:hypothetical protein